MMNRYEAVDQTVAQRPAPGSPLPANIQSIQILRFLAAFMVTLLHCHQSLVRQIPGHVTDGTDLAFAIGASGVHVFFVVSGFVMVFTATRSRLTPGSFLKRRLLRIFPIYWLLAAAYLLARPLLGAEYALNWPELLGAAILWPTEASTIIGPGWSLGYEMYFYLCFAIALFLGVARGLWALTAFYVASIAIGFLVKPGSPLLAILTNSLLLEFLAGCWIAHLLMNRTIAIQPAMGGLLALAGVAGLLAGIGFDYWNYPSVLVWGVPSALIIAGAVALEPWLRGGVARVMAKLGDSSYFLYLAHVLIIQLLLSIPLFGVEPGYTEAFAVLLALVCSAIAHVGYLCVEAPMRQAIKSSLVRRPASGIPAIKLAS